LLPVAGFEVSYETANMKIRYLLLGLMLCVAGAGTINSSDGSFGDQNQTPFLIFGHVWYEGGAPCNNPIVNITNEGTGGAWCVDTPGYNYYRALLCGANVGVGDMLEFDVTDGMGFNNTSCMVNPGDLDDGGIFGFNLTLPTLSPLVDVELTPDDDMAMPGVQVINPDYLTTDITVTITANVTDPDDYGNITGVVVDIAGADTVEMSPVSLMFVSNSSTTTARYIGRFNISSHPPGDYEVVIKATNTGGFTGTASKNFTNLHAAAIAPMSLSASQSTSPSPVIICGYVSYPDGSTCTSPYVVVTNLNTSEELVAETQGGESFYQLVTSSAFVKAGDTLKIAADKNGSPVGSAVYVVNGTDIGQGLIEVNINVGVPDFTVTDITFDLSEPLIGDVVEIGATIANLGAERVVFVEFYDNKSINIERVLNEHPESPINNTITFPDAIRIRAHFKSFDVSSMGNITIHNESRLVEWLNETGTDHWTGWCDGGTIRIESWNAGFVVDRYEAVLANVSISLGLEESTNISAVWNLSDQSVGWAVNGTHDITVRVDPCDQVVESDETNNEKTGAVDVCPSLDFAVTNISLDQTKPVLGDAVGINANISNYGVRNGTTVVGVYYDNMNIEISVDEDRNIHSESESYTSTDNILLPSGVLGARLHFDDLYVYNGHVDICDNNGRVVERFYGMGLNDPAISVWTDCIYTDNITVRIEMPHNPAMVTHRCNFTIDRYEARIAEEPVTLNVTESKVINTSWLTGAVYGGAGDHNITVMVDPRNHSVETNETNNTQTEGIVVNGTDLAVTGIEIEIPGGVDCYLGLDVNVTAVIANLGAIDATNLTVVFLDGTCSNYSAVNKSGIIFSEIHIDRLNSGETTIVSAVWSPKETGYHMINVNVSTPYDGADSNETNNELNSSHVFVDARYDFSVESVNVEPQTIERGESVNITATIGNSNISHTGGNVSVAFFVNWTDFAGTCGERFTRIGTIDDVYLGIGETRTVSMRWGVDVAGGCHMMAAVVNPDRELDEINPPGGTRYLPYSTTIQFRGDTGNNAKNCTLHVTRPDLDITNITLVPAEPNSGDMVSATAEIENNGADASSTVWFYMQNNESISGVADNRGDYDIHWSQSSVLQPEVPIRFHFDYVKISKENVANASGMVDASVTDEHGQPHPVCFYVRCEKYGGQYVKTPKIHYNTTGYDESDNNRSWYDVWTDWTTGTALEINAMAMQHDQTNKVFILIDKYQVRLDNRTVTLNAGESGLFTTEWNTSFPLKPGKNYTILANVEDKRKESRDVYLGGTDLAVTDLSTKLVVMDGDRVWVSATIKNLGRMDATAFTVNFSEIYTYEREYDQVEYPVELINTTHIRSLGAGNSINILVPWNASIQDIGDEWISDYTINVTILPLENTNREENETNNILERDICVSPSRDFVVTDLSFIVNGTACDPLELSLYDDVVLNATVGITNLANQGGSVDMRFYIDETDEEHEIGRDHITFDAGGGTEYAEIGWGDIHIPGNHNLIVVLDPEGGINETKEGNNVSTWEIRVNAPELVLQSLDLHPANPDRGETVSINVTITNDGMRDASNVTLEICDWSERHIEDTGEQSGPGREELTIKRENATAMRLYLDLWVEDGCRVCINDSGGREIIGYHKDFHGWTPWLLDNNITVVVKNTETSRASAMVSKVYHLSGSTIDGSTHNLGIGEEKSIAVNWNPSVVGERLIAATLDPDDHIAEYNESDNRLTRFISVQTADLTVSNISLWQNGVEIGENDTIRHGDIITMTVDIANTGVGDAGDSNVRFLIDNIPIKEKPIPDLANGSLISRSANWSAAVGSHLVKVEVDFGNRINETNETDNIVASTQYVCGAELSGKISWETLGLHNETLYGPDQPYDEDDVIITTTINNSGEMPAANFGTAIVFNYTSDPFQKICGHNWSGGKWINRTYPDAEYLYLKVSTPVSVSGSCRCMTKDDVIVYDGNGSEVARPHRSCSILVYGNTTNVFITPQGYSFKPVFDIYFYPIYQNETSRLFGGINVPPGSLHSILMNRTVSAGNFTIMAVIDPGNEAPEDEDHREDNVISRMMCVKPTRDFVVADVAAACTNLSDLDTTDITAEVANTGLRSGTVNVSIIDYEEESRTYNYHYDTNRSLSYLPIPPDATLSGFQYDASRIPGKQELHGYDNLTIIHRPGADAIELHFNKITLYKPFVDDLRAGVMSVHDENEEQVWIRSYLSGNLTDETIRVPGETAYIYTCKAIFDLDRYTTERELFKEGVALNASKTWNESKDITVAWEAYTGDHTITVALDEEDEINEMNESNNELSPSFIVNASRDPTIIELNIAPENPVDGDDVDITAVVANDGFRHADFTFDLWAETIIKEDVTDLPAANLTTDLGDRIRYIRLLKHTNLTLAPGENMTVNTTWNDITITGSPEYHVIAIVDPTDEIDEMNESNNEIKRKIMMSYPDFTIGGSYVPGGKEKPVVTIKEIGSICGAPDVTVRFEATETETCHITRCGWFSPKKASGASSIRAHFDYIDARNGWVEIREKPQSRPLKIYSRGEFSGWSPWVDGDKIYINCHNAWIDIDEYDWGNVSDEQIDLGRFDREDVEIPWTDEYREPYDLNVTVDPDNNITELNENNNDKTIRMGPDIVWSLDASYKPSYLAVDHPINYIISVKNEGMQSLPKFNVTLCAGLAGDEMVPVENHTIEEILKGHGSCPVKFEWEPPVDGSYNFTVRADPENMVIELDENNNEYCFQRPVFPDLGYGGSYLKTYADDEVNGSFIFKMGTRTGRGNPKQWYQGEFGSGDTYEMKWNTLPPADAKIKIARLYLYWGWTERGFGYTTPPTEFNVKFNNHLLPQEPAHPDYSDYPIEEGINYRYNYAYGVYCYDVKDYFTGSDEATVTIDNLYGAHSTCIAGMSLVIVYESDEGVLTRYWINEGADVLGCASDFSSLLPDDCTTEVVFEGEVDTDGLSNATLITVVPWGSEGNTAIGPGDTGWDLFKGTKWVGKRKNGLYFNGKELKDGAYICDYSVDSVGIDEREVKDHLVKHDNVAGIQDRGDNMMLSANGFLVLRYPPDLNIINLTAPASTVVGAHHSINVTIRNDGRSDAHDFNVTFHIDGKQMIRIPHLDLPAGNSTTLHLYNWTPMMLGHVYNLTAAADVLSGADWTEVETDNNAMTKRVMIEEGGFGNQTGPRGIGGGSNPTGGEYTERITGRVMQGMKEFLSFGGGGGAGMFSLTEWIMKGAVWLVLMLFVCTGYFMEQRSYGRVSAGYAGAM
jgi:subtilase family serine protease